MKHFSTLALALLLAAPATAQLAPGDDIDVYDANGDRVGRLIDRVGQQIPGLDGRELSVSLRYDEDVFTAVARTTRWFSRVQVAYTSDDCTGTPFGTEDSFGRSEDDRVYVAKGHTLFRFDQTGNGQVMQHGSRFNGADCSADSDSLKLFPGEELGTLPHAFPLHMRPAAAAVTPAEFDALLADVDALALRIGDLEDSDDVQAGEIQQLQTDLDALRARVSAIESIPKIARKLRKQRFR